MTKQYIDNPVASGRLSREWFELVTEICNAVRSFSGGPGVLVSHGEDGVVISLGRQAISRGQIVRMRVKSESNDTLTCHTWDGVNEGSADIVVAKPWDLRGATATKTESGVVATITKAYGVNDEIAASVISGGTGATGAGYLDINVDARRWIWSC